MTTPARRGKQFIKLPSPRRADAYLDLYRSDSMPELSDTSTKDPEAQQDGTASAEGQIYDTITNEPVRDTPLERVVQAVARSLAEEYDFDHTQLQRDQLASQDPPSLPSAIIELSSLVILHRFNSPGWLKHVQRSITSLADLTPAQMTALAPGEAYLWATKATERVFMQKAVKARLRPRVTRHGGGDQEGGVNRLQETQMQKEAEYTLFLAQVGKLAERRQAMTATYLSVNAAIVGAVAFLFKDGVLPGWQQQAAVLVLFGAGIVACDLWRRLLLQYRTLLSWWYKRLHLLEAEMPECSGLIKQEYDELYATQKGRSCLGLTRYETRLTWLFTALYAAFALAIAVGWVV